MPTLKQLQAMAAGLGVKNDRRLSKPDLIREIQRAEGYSPCFGTIPDCGQTDCLFFVDCVGPLAQGRGQP